MRGPARTRFALHVDALADGCWPWQGAIQPNGYGYAWVDGRMHYAHRVAYEWECGVIPSGLDLDHLCHTADGECEGGDSCIHRRCVNPWHLEPVTRRQNLLRSPRTLTSAHSEGRDCGFVGCHNGICLASQGIAGTLRFRAEDVEALIASGPPSDDDAAEAAL